MENYTVLVETFLNDGNIEHTYYYFCLNNLNYFCCIQNFNLLFT